MAKAIDEKKVQVAKHLGDGLNTMGIAKAKQGLSQEALTIWADALHVHKFILKTSCLELAPFPLTAVTQVLWEDIRSHILCTGPTSLPLMGTACFVQTV